MKNYQKSALWIAGVGLASMALITGFRNCSNYEINNSNLISSSRGTTSLNPLKATDKTEYTILKDGSEEILIREGKRMFLYHNFDGDNKIDRIRIDKYTSRDIFNLENILVRGSNYNESKADFDKADNILARERQLQ